MALNVPWEQVRRDYEQGATCQLLAERYGVSTSTVSRRARSSARSSGESRRNGLVPVPL